MSKGKFNKPTQPFEAHIFWDYSERQLADKMNKQSKTKAKRDKALKARYAELHKQGKLK